VSNKQSDQLNLSEALEGVGMNDNLTAQELRKQRNETGEQDRAAQIALIQDLAARAVLRPESLTTTEMQEVGWGCLMALDKLLKPRRRPL
jgi:hypothetical protein